MAAVQSAITSENATRRLRAKLQIPESRETVEIQLNVRFYTGVLMNVLRVFEQHLIELDPIQSIRISPETVQLLSQVPNLAQHTIKSKAFFNSLAILGVQKLRVGDTELKQVSQSDDKWIPFHVSDLDEIAKKADLMASACEIAPDHPGAADPVYQRRRSSFADLANGYRYSDPEIPRVAYTETENRTWRVIMDKLINLVPEYACKEFIDAWPGLVRSCRYNDGIPQLEDVSRYLYSKSGFRLRPAAGFLTARDFLAGLAHRTMYVCQYIRHGADPMFSPEPDICHDLIGHVPMLANQQFADFSQVIGLASFGASDKAIEQLARNYYFTVEVGLTKEGLDKNGKENVKVYGAGIMSCMAEMQYFISGKADLVPYVPEECGRTEAPLTGAAKDMDHPRYFVGESLAQIKSQMEMFAATIQRPFEVSYNKDISTVGFVMNHVSLDQRS